MSLAYDDAIDRPSVPAPKPTMAEKLVVMARDLVEDGYRLSGLSQADFIPTDANCDAAKDRAIAGRRSDDPEAYKLRLDTAFAYFREARIVFEENPELHALKTGPIYQEAADAHVLMLSEQRFFSDRSTDRAVKDQPCIDRNGAEYDAKPDTAKSTSAASTIRSWVPPVGQSAPAYVM